MSIILAILKVLGIILLVILLIVLALVIFVLASPIRYESVGNAGPDSIKLRLKITWLLKIVRINGSVSNDKILVEVRALWFRVIKKAIPWEYPLAKKKEEDTAGMVGRTASGTEQPEISAVEKKPEEQKAEEQKTEEQKAEEQKAEEQKAEEQKAEEQKSEEQQPEPHYISSEQQTPEMHTEQKNEVIPVRESRPGEDTSCKESEKKGRPKEDTSRKKSEKKDRPKKDTSHKKSDKKDRAKKPPFDGLKEKWNSVSEKIQQVRSVLEDPSVWKTARLVKKILFRILNHIRPRTLRIHGRFGTGDPAADGQILGIFYMGYPVYGNHGDYRLSSDFQSKTLQGKYYLKGRIVLAVIAFCALRLLADKNIRRLIFRKK